MENMEKVKHSCCKCITHRFFLLSDRSVICLLPCLDNLIPTENFRHVLVLGTAFIFRWSTGHALSGDVNILNPDPVTLDNLSWGHAGSPIWHYYFEHHLNTSFNTSFMCICHFPRICQIAKCMLLVCLPFLKTSSNYLQSASFMCICHFPRICKIAK